MTRKSINSPAALPSVDRILRSPSIDVLIEEHGRTLVTAAVRSVLGECRRTLIEEGGETSEAELLAKVSAELGKRLSPSLRAVFNLTGTVLHTNLGRSPLPEEAIAAMTAVARGATNLEFDLSTGRRGERNRHIEGWIQQFCGAEAAVVVNNNAAAVLLVLNTLARRKEVPVSRGELIEIGGAFRIPDIMARAGCKLVEVGTTNRTHLKDYANALSSRTGLLMKVHTSNYVVEGFTASVPEAELATLAHAHGQVLVTDLGSGTLIDLEGYGLPAEPTVRSMIDQGVDVVTFSGDKLLGGPQAGLIAGRETLIDRIRKNPMMRALRVDKVTLAALEAVLTLYASPEKLVERLPAHRLLARAASEIQVMAERLAPLVRHALGDTFEVAVTPCRSQVGSGALPVDRLASAGLRITPANGKSARSLNRLSADFRRLPVPVVGRIGEGALNLDLRCLEDERGFLAQLERLGQS